VPIDRAKAPMIKQGLITTIPMVELLKNSGFDIAAGPGY
jgi:hypothetical protein